MILLTAKVVLIGFAVTTGAYHSFLLHLNWRHSSDMTQVCCWIFWWTQDILTIVIGTATIALLPASCILQALVYRMDVMHVCKFIRNLRSIKGAEATAAQIGREIDRVIDMMAILEERAADVAHYSTPILFVIILTTTPVTTCCLFVSRYSDNVIVAVSYAVVACNMALFAFTLQAIAGDITCKAQHVYAELSSLASASITAPVSSRIQLLRLLQEADSESEPLAMHTLSGERYTKASFIEYVMEACVHFSLLVTFSSFLLISQSS